MMHISPFELAGALPLGRFLHSWALRIPSYHSVSSIISTTAPPRLLENQTHTNVHDTTPKSHHVNQSIVSLSYETTRILFASAPLFLY